MQTYFDLDSRLNEYLRPLINKGAKNTILVSDEDALQGKVWFAPTVEEQKKIGDFFRELDNSITKYEQEINLLNKIKKGCIQKNVCIREGYACQILFLMKKRTLKKLL